MATQHDTDSDLDTDAVLAELEAEEDRDISNLRSQRASEFLSAAESKNKTTTTTSISQNAYITLKSDDDTLQFTTDHSRAVVHFFHPDFARCGVMDEHLTVIAQKHADYATDASGEELQFARVDVRHAEFVVEKLAIRVLPCVIGFVKGQIKGRIIGFEGVSWGGKEKGLTVTKAIEECFVDWTVLRRGLVKSGDDDQSESEEEERLSKLGRRGITGRKQDVDDEDDDWD